MSVVELPRGFLNAGNVALEGLFAEADAAEIEIAHKTARTATFEATAHRARRELRLAVCLHYH